MNCRSTILAFLAVAGCVSMPAQAQSMKPGLWEINNRMQSSDGQMEKAMAEAQKQMASMPPDQRKMMEEMMAKQGVSMGPAGKGGAGMSVKICMTKEMVERSEVPVQQDHKGHCTHNRSPMVGNTMKISYTCTNPTSSGEGQVTFSGNEAYSMKMSMKSDVNGKPQQMNMDASGKWLGADCGSIKPFMPPNTGKK